MNLSSWSIANPVAVILLFMLLTLAGLYGFRAMKVQNTPEIEFPVITIIAVLPGASPPQLETDVVQKIEDSVANIQQLKNIRSSISDSVAIITAEFRLEKAVQEAIDDVRDAVSIIRADLPRDLQDPVIKRQELTSTPVLTYTLSSSQWDDEALSWFVDNKVRRKLMSVSGVGGVSRIGGVNREIHIDLLPEQLLALNTTASDVSRQIAQYQQAASGGRAQPGGTEQSIRTIATVASAQELGSMDISLNDGRRIRLEQIATIADTTAEQRSLVRMNGKLAVGFEIVRARGAGELDVAHGAREVIDALMVEHPAIQFTEAVNYVDLVQENYQGSMTLLYEGALLAVLVVLFFLRDWRATVIVAVALPLSIIPTFAVLHFMGFSLNIISLLSLSLVVGVLVDDAIVEIENIKRHMMMGKTPLKAATEAADEIGFAVIATSLTLIAVFLPTSLMGGIAGKYFLQFGWTAAIAVFFSLLVARMLTPTMAAYLLKVPAQKHTTPNWVRVYLVCMRTCLTRPKITLAATGLIVAIGLITAVTLPGEFMPPDNDNQTQVTLSLPPGSTLQQTEIIAGQARELIIENPQVKSVYTVLGASGSNAPGETSGSESVATAVLTINLTRANTRRGISSQTIESQLSQTLRVLPGVRIRVGSGREVYQLVLASEDEQLLTRQANIIERELREIPGIGTVTSSASLVRPELIIRPDFARAADLGVTSAAIAETLRIATVGDYDQALAKLNLNERQIPIVVKLATNGRDDINTLRRLPVPGLNGPVPLESVADLEFSNGPSELTRYNRMRNIELSVELNGQPMSRIEDAVAALPGLKELPSGVVVANTGDAEMMEELVYSFTLAMLAGVACVYTLLVLLLKDFAQPVTVLVALALSIPGAFLALLATGSSLSMPSMIGLIMLMGITTKNAILLVDYIIIARRDHGYNRRRALADACRKRARPIVMTTIAMCAGMFPIAIGLGADPSFRAPMAIVVIGGLISSTVLCLLVIPIVYSIVDDVEETLKKRFKPERDTAIKNNGEHIY